MILETLKWAGVAAAIALFVAALIVTASWLSTYGKTRAWRVAGWVLACIWFVAILLAVGYVIASGQA